MLREHVLDVPNMSELPSSMLPIPLTMPPPSISSEGDKNMEVMMIEAANWIGLSTVATAAGGENGDGNIDTSTFDFAGDIDVLDPPRAKRVL